LQLSLLGSTHVTNFIEASMAAKDKSVYDWKRWVSFNGLTLNESFVSTKKLTRSTDGGSNPNWRNTIRLGGDATNTLVASFDEYTCSPGHQTGRFYNQWDMYQGYFDPRTMYWRGYRAPGSCTQRDPDASLISVADARARSNFNKQLRSFSSAMQGGVFVGELREALGMLRRPAQSLFEGIGKYVEATGKRSRSVRKNLDSKGKPHPSYTKEVGKIAAESWLEYAFGWRPFIGDIEDAFKALDNLRDEERHVNVSAGGQSDKFGGNVNGQQGLYGYLKVQTYDQWWYKCHVRYKGCIVIKPQTTNADLAKNWGFHPDQFVPTAWELIPWSFLADYFTNIGDILAYDSSVKSQLRWCCRGVRNECVSRLDMVHDQELTKAAFGGRWIYSDGSRSFAIHKRISVTREKSNGGADLTFSDFQISIPTVPTQWLNMAALLASGNSIHAQRFNRL
jgi:hypothetical protein